MTRQGISDAEILRMADDYASTPSAFWLEWAVDAAKEIRELRAAYAQNPYANSLNRVAGSQLQYYQLHQASLSQAYRNCQVQQYGWIGSAIGKVL